MTFSQIASNLFADGVRPTVVLADDHVRMLEIVSNLLASDFEVVATVADGQQALAATLQHDPDAVVLDITMPALDGLQTARALKRMNSRAKIVFTTMHDADEYVTTAIDVGACGYVRKSRIPYDLVSAIGHALAGRIFVPSLRSLSAIGGVSHAVRFHERSFLSGLAVFLGSAIRRGDVVALCGTAATRAGLEEEWSRCGLDVTDEGTRGRYLSWDAMDDVSQLLRTGLDTGRVATVVENLERQRVAASEGGQVRVTAYGETSALLLQAGHADAAIALERCWDDLTRGLPFLTVCGYPIDSFAGQEHPEVLAGICASHGAVCHAAHLM